MDGIKILHAADFHIGSSKSGLKESAYSGSEEIKNTFFKVLNLCRTESVDFLLIAGDLFDTPFVDSDTFAEISDEEKNRISHRYRALYKLKEFLDTI